MANIRPSYLCFLVLMLLIPVQSYAQDEGVNITRLRRTDENLAVRVKDVANIEGVRDNQLIGYGLVIGLNHTGDRVQQNIYAKQTLQNLLERMGISVKVETLKPENIATVIVTSTLPPFVRQGNKIDVTISSIGDAKSLQGGTLVLSTLKGIDGQIYAVAQGAVSTGGISAGSKGNSVDINHPTVARIANGATVERRVALELGNLLTLNLKQEDFTTAARLQQVINNNFGDGCARAIDSRNVEVRIPEKLLTDPINFIAQLESLRVSIDSVAKVVINERTGTIVLGQNVRLSAVAISQGGITVRIGTELQVSQPAPLSDKGKTVIVPKTSVKITEKPTQAISLNDGVTVDEFIRGLRMMGVTTSGVISILQAIKSAGALNAELEMQ